ncbi:hypothetical protein BS50DRAFT_649265 [Corynespora cassiicola Philippines]|uniref:Uncharacterized protein n=1 Tax=Corynespora cassiicola Philippines TaxID=1448308 RepID=A0A2T2NAD2_CORCC|nr:hypothetical protein BS50DRAFT_649265 [Corynespora cassiicola Philippines]
MTMPPPTPRLTPCARIPHEVLDHSFLHGPSSDSLMKSPSIALTPSPTPSKRPRKSSPIHPCLPRSQIHSDVGGDFDMDLFIDLSDLPTITPPVVQEPSSSSSRRGSSPLFKKPFLFRPSSKARRSSSSTSQTDPHTLRKTSSTRSSSSSSSVSSTASIPISPGTIPLPRSSSSGDTANKTSRRRCSSNQENPSTPRRLNIPLLTLRSSTSTPDLHSPVSPKDTSERGHQPQAYGFPFGRPCPSTRGRDLGSIPRRLHLGSDSERKKHEKKDVRKRDAAPPNFLPPAPRYTTTATRARTPSLNTSKPLPPLPVPSAGPRRSSHSPTPTPPRMSRTTSATKNTTISPTYMAHPGQLVDFSSRAESSFPYKRVSAGGEGGMVDEYHNFLRGRGGGETERRASLEREGVEGVISPADWERN